MVECCYSALPALPLRPDHLLVVKQFTSKVLPVVIGLYSNFFCVTGRKPQTTCRKPNKVY